MRDCCLPVRRAQTGPRCNSKNYLPREAYGHIHNGKQNYQCKDCGREFVLNPEKLGFIEELYDSLQSGLF